MLPKNILPLLDGLTSAIFVVDCQRNVIIANKAGLETFGSKIVGSDFVNVIRDPNCLKALDKTINGRKSFQLEVALQGLVRTTYRVNISRVGAKKLPVDTSAARATISLENISHIREAEMMRSDFVSNVSHELRSPLTAINGFIATLKGAAKDDEQARERFLGIMEDEAQRMVRLIEDLLSLSKVQASEHLAPDDHIDLIALINRAMEILQPAAKLENIELNFKIEGEIENQIAGDADQLLQVFLNLLENAIKYGGENSPVDINISTKNRVAGLRGKAVIVQIMDYGPGIASQHLPRLTERFYRVDTGRSRQKGGTGLGLAIVKHIIARHRGRLQISSSEKGSSFTIILPV